MEKTMFNLLIIEDNHDVNSMLREVLVNEGYAVDSAYTGIDGQTNLYESHNI